MKYAIALTVAVFVLVAVASPQLEHAPTVEQCQADQELWFSKLETNESTSDVTFDTLRGWISEMGDCQSVDKPNWHEYYHVEAEATQERSQREFDFIVRHGLATQFVSEDAAGKR
jgi:hypothetical protein